MGASLLKNDYLCGMFVRRRVNRSGTTSVVDIVRVCQPMSKVVKVGIRFDRDTMTVGDYVVER